MKRDKVGGVRSSFDFLVTVWDSIWHSSGSSELVVLKMFCICRTDM
jgi:hypothetical protein